MNDIGKIIQPGVENTDLEAKAKYRRENRNGWENLRLSPVRVLDTLKAKTFPKKIWGRTDEHIYAADQHDVKGQENWPWNHIEPGKCVRYSKAAFSDLW